MGRSKRVKVKLQTQGPAFFSFSKKINIFRNTLIEPMTREGQ
jgi:hypothetical protein